MVMAVVFGRTAVKGLFEKMEKVKIFCNIYVSHEVLYKERKLEKILTLFLKYISRLSFIKVAVNNLASREHYDRPPLLSPSS